MAADASPGLTDVHAHPAMNAFLWGVFGDRDLRRHYWSGSAWNPLASVSDFKMLRKGGVKVLWSSLHVPEPHYFEQCRPLWAVAHIFSGGRLLLKHDEWKCLEIMTGKMERQVGRAKGFRMAKSNAELDEVLAAGDTAIVHTVEGAHVLGAGLPAGDVEGRLARLDELAGRGVASLTLAHLFPNDVAGHVEAIPPKQKKNLFCSFDTGVEDQEGLSDPLGHAVVRRMAEVRIVPDVSHCTPAARRKVYELVGDRIPIVASHVGVRSMNDEPYNLDEGDVRAIAASGGLVGVIFMTHWLDATEPEDGRDAIWRTMEQVHEWSGGTWDHVAIGTDFDGFTTPPRDCKNSSKLPVIRELLVDKGLAPTEVDAILGGNARRVLREGWR